MNNSANAHAAAEMCSNARLYVWTFVCVPCCCGCCVCFVCASCVLERERARDKRKGNPLTTTDVVVVVVVSPAACLPTTQSMSDAGIACNVRTYVHFRHTLDASYNAANKLLLACRRCCWTQNDCSQAYLCTLTLHKHISS